MRIFGDLLQSIDDDEDVPTSIRAEASGGLHPKACNDLPPGYDKTYTSPPVAT